ncbi:MAG: hypothetical protein AAFY31_04980 [Pseudomonadota bacterium]
MTDTFKIHAALLLGSNIPGGRPTGGGGSAPSTGADAKGRQT